MFLRELFENKETVGIIFGRFNPPHKGHKAAWELASKCTYWYVGTNKSTQGPKDPLPFDVKVEAMKAIWPEVANNIIAEQSWLTLASHCYNAHKNASELICFTDEDWVTKTIIQYNGKEGPHGFYNFAEIKQHPTPRLSSATALRAAVQAGDRNAFADAAGVPADTPVAGHPFFDVVSHYLSQFADAPKKAPAKKKAVPTESLTVCRVCGQSPCNCTGIKKIYEDSQLQEMAMDSIVTSKYGKLLWLNDGGVHMIARKEPNGSLHIFTMGDHSKIAKQWAAIKQRYGQQKAEDSCNSCRFANEGCKSANEDCAGVGIVTKQNSTKDVGPGTLRKNMKAFHLTDDILEAAYSGNIGMMELFQFFSNASPELVAKVKELISQHKDKEVWHIIQKHTGTKLVGKEFN